MSKTVPIFEIACLLILTILTSCATMDVQVGYDDSVELSHFQSYTLASDEYPKTGNPILDDPEVHSVIRESIRTELNARYYKNRESSGEFVVGYEVVAESREDVITQFEVENYPLLYGRKLGYEPAGTFDDGTLRYVREVQEGTLIVTLTEPNDERVIWRGVVKAEIRQAASEVERVNRIRQAVQKVMKSIPDSQRN